MAGEKKAALVVAVLALSIAAPPASWADDRVERRIELASCSDAERDAHGRAEYREDDDGRERLRFDIDDTTSGLIGQTLDVFVDDEFMGSMRVREDEDEPGEGEGTLEFDSDDGDELPTTLEGNEDVDIRRDDQNDEPNGEELVSNECDPPSEESSSQGQPGGTPPNGGVLESLLGLLGLG